MKMKSTCNWTALAIGLSFLLANRAPAPIGDTFTWVGGANTKWANSTNWIRGVANTGTNTIPDENSFVTFNGTASGYTVDLESAQAAGSISFGGATSYNLLGGALDLYGISGISANGSASYAVAPSILIHDTQEWFIDGSSRVVINHDVLSVGGGNGLTKIGTGTLLLNGLCNCGDVAVIGGTLGGTGTVQAWVTIQSGSTLAPGNSIGKFTASGSLTNGGMYRCEIDGATNDSLVVGGTLAISSGAIGFDVLPGGATQPVYVIASYGTRSGAFSAVSNLPPGFVLDYAYFNGVTSNNVALVYTPGGSDACTNAPVVREGTYSGSNTLATHDGTSSCNTSTNSRDMWFIYKASSNGVANARTGPDLGTDFDTTLAVFDGCGGNELISNDDAYNDGFVGISEVSWVVTAGQMYWIRVAGSSGETGNYTLEVRVDPQPINDNCANALAVTDGSYLGTTVGTTTEGMLVCANPETHDVWFVYTNPDECARDVTFSTCNGITDFDTVLRAYNGCGGSLLGSNDDGCAGPNSGASTLTRTVAPGASVWIRLNGFGSTSGDYQLDVSSVYNPLTLCASQRPALAIAPAGAGSNTISWAPDLPGFVLQETPSLAPAAWTNSHSGTNHPITVSATNSASFYRLFKP